MSGICVLVFNSHEYKVTNKKITHKLFLVVYFFSNSQWAILPVIHNFEKRTYPMHFNCALDNNKSINSESRPLWECSCNNSTWIFNFLNLSEYLQTQWLYILNFGIFFFNYFTYIYKWKVMLNIDINVLFIFTFIKIFIKIFNYYCFPKDA